MPTSKDTNYLKENEEYDAEKAKEVAKEIFAPLEQGNAESKEQAYKALDELLASDAEFKNKYDQVLNKILAEALYKKLLEMKIEDEQPIEEGFLAAASKRY